MGVTELFVRIAIAFTALLAMARIAGRKEISQMTFFNFVSAITFGTIAGSIVTSNAFSIRNGLIALAGWTAFTLVFSFLDIKWGPFRKVVEGSPQIVIKKGKIMEDTLRKTQLDVDALNVLLRKKNIFSISDVDYAIFEIDGTLSVMKKQDKQPLTARDMQIRQTPNAYPIGTEIISDGVVNHRNLTHYNLDTEWLESELKKLGVASAGDVFYAELLQDGSLYIDERVDELH
ncbi:DUF421 domain-containing protein [Bacillus marinisedimentorum]|uniref:DUF421 domain-containing protein n=1 Tax=Bacillus marinisedimentorum TaxID=1821260 RepID=UPI0007E02C27|nr:DUF421 domain-containing protein [Bacillus marinisedimentorum]